ncbi:major facilitator superfamily domain-containing protein [Dipodascopsis tothii]|uniref:major facilitator superfamily domain-containing protein n=1 Tax=Dipodascopsis tothii TaxID=44089 RepID=UPI0034CDDF91
MPCRFSTHQRRSNFEMGFLSDFFRNPDQISWYNPLGWPYTEEQIKADPTLDPYYDPPGWVPSRARVFFSVFWESIRKPPGERRYVQKLDRGLLFYLMFSYMIKSLDQKNISNAYVSGMKEDLNLDGNEYNYFTTLFNCGYLVGSVPAQWSLRFVRPSLMIPAMECTWTIFVMLLSRATSARYIYIFRFFQGMAESICYPTMMMILGSWYKPDEIAKRVVIWDMSWNLASMFSGYIQAGVYTNLDGINGLAGWQWLFIVDGCISLPVALTGLYAIPDFPTTTKARWLSERDIAYSIRRMKEVGKKGTRKMTVRRFIQIFTGWRFWSFLLPYSLYIVGAGDYMNLWLEDIGYSVQMTNILPTIGSAVALVSGYILAIISDITLWRWQIAMAALVPYVFGNLVLAIWDVPFGLKFAANIIPYIGSSFFSQFMAWISEIFQDDTELRGFLPAIGNTLWYCNYAWFPVVAFPASKAPHYPWGYWAAFGLAIANMVTIYTCRMAHMWDVKRRGLVKNKFGMYVEREDLVEYLEDEPSLTSRDVKLTGVVEAVHELDSSNYDIEKNMHHRTSIAKP